MKNTLLRELDEAVLREKKERAEQHAFEEAQRLRGNLFRFAVSRAPLDGEEPCSIAASAKSTSCCRFGARNIEGLLAPRGTRLGVVICHPWGPVGGSMFDLNVVFTAYAFRACTTLRFNFRSGMDCGITAAEDLRAAHSCSRRRTAGAARAAWILVRQLVVADVAPQLDAAAAFGLLMPPLGAGPPRPASRATRPSEHGQHEAKLAVIGTRPILPPRRSTRAQSLNEPAEVACRRAAVP